MKTREEFYDALDDFFCANPGLDGIEITSVYGDSFWYAIGERGEETYLLAEDGDGISADKLEDEEG